MKQYRALLFDLFGTVALFNYEKLPVFEWEGKTSRSTMGRLRVVYNVYEELAAAAPFEQFYTAFLEVSHELSEQRAQDMREVSSVSRFTHALVRTGFGESVETRDLAQQLSHAHMTLLAGAIEIPPAHAELLDRVCGHYRVALVSNFDHGPTARHILNCHQIDKYFDPIVISEEHGWRKPHPKIFADTLTALGVEPSTALFVGDSPADDIVGARDVGIDVAWVNRQKADLPRGIPRPTYEIRAVPEIETILFA